MSNETRDDMDLLDVLSQVFSKMDDEPVKRIATGDEIGEFEHVARRPIDASANQFPNIDFSKTLFDLLSGTLGLYDFTTEDIGEYMPDLAANGKRCLTVASSGDHVINLLAAGAEEIVAFDSVEAAGEVTWLKLQALADLDWTNAKDFSRNLWSTALDRIVFARLRDRAYDPSYGTHRAVMKTVVNSIPEKHRRLLFKQHQTRGYNSYLADESSFETAKAACRRALDDGRVSFVHADVRDLPLLELGEFDVIAFSNILQARLGTMISPYPISRMADHWVGREIVCGGKALKGMVDTMVWPIARMLSPGGVMMAAYVYGCNDEEWERIEREEAEEEGEEYRPAAITSAPLRREAFAAVPGFSVEERAWSLVNGELSGHDLGIFIRREA